MKLFHDFKKAVTKSNPTVKQEVEDQQFIARNNLWSTLSNTSFIILCLILDRINFFTLGSPNVYQYGLNLLRILKRKCWLSHYLLSPKKWQERNNRELLLSKYKCCFCSYILCLLYSVHVKHHKLTICNHFCLIQIIYAANTGQMWTTSYWLKR